MISMVTWGDWLTSSGFGGTAAVLAAAIAFVGVARSVAAQRRIARRTQWWDAMKWAVEMALSSEDAIAEAGLTVLTELERTEGLDRDDSAFVAALSGLFLPAGESGTLEPKGVIDGI